MIKLNLTTFISILSIDEYKVLTLINKQILSEI
jgi:hypothetical protein